jgi:type I restriction enzyme S subunit
MKISDIAEVINETVKEPSKSGIDVFVGLEHYDIAEPVIKRFGSTQMLSTAAKVFKKGDVLIARRNVYLQRAAMAPFSGLTSGDSIVLRVKDNFDTKETDYETMSKLLPFILNSIDFWDYANTNADGTMSKRLSPALLLDYEFDLPSKEEQKLRAEKLWAAYEVKQSYLKMIKATQEMVQL